jgi:hypothetical protein
MVGFSRYYSLMSGLVLTAGIVLTTGLAGLVREWEQTPRPSSKAVAKAFRSFALAVEML